MSRNLFEGFIMAILETDGISRVVGGGYGGADNSLTGLILGAALGGGGLFGNRNNNDRDSLTDNIHTASINNLKETADAARDTVDAVRDSITATNQIGNINLQATERNGGETRTSVERSAGETRSAIDAASNQIARDFAGVHQSLCQVRQEQSEGFGDTKLEMCKQHSEIKLEMCKQHGELARQIDARAAEAAKQLAECCCKLEGEHAATRQLLQSQALDECRRREGDLQNQVNLLKIAQMNGPGNS